jgi:transcriptional regulator with XRE-family HTH domain
VLRLRRLRGMTQEELAERIRSKQPALARIESGRSGRVTVKKRPKPVPAGGPSVVQDAEATRAVESVQVQGLSIPLDRIAVRRLSFEELERLAELFGRPRAQLFRYGARRGPAPASSAPLLAETLLEQLRYWRGVANFSLEQAATVLGISREAYRQRETGVAPISGAEFALLARTFGRSLFEIFPAYTPTEGEELLCQALVESGRV